MDLDSERIILEVEQYPCLYDTRTSEYKNRDMKREAWLVITGNVVGDEWEEMDETKKSSIGKEVQKRWKSMKDSYMKYLRNEAGKSGDPSNKKKLYIYHKQMSFLQTVCEQRETSGNMTSEPQAPPVGMLEDVREPNSLTTPATGISGCSLMPKKRKTDAFEDNIVKILNSNVGPTTSTLTTQSQDPDEMFLLSQLPIIKQMSQHDKMDFQIKFIQLLQTYNKRHTSQAPLYMPPSVQSHVSYMSSNSNASTPNHNLDIDEDSVLSFYVM